MAGGDRIYFGYLTDIENNRYKAVMEETFSQVGYTDASTKIAIQDDLYLYSIDQKNVYKINKYSFNLEGIYTAGQSLRTLGQDKEYLYVLDITDKLVKINKSNLTKSLEVSISGASNSFLGIIADLSYVYIILSDKRLIKLNNEKLTQEGTTTLTSYGTSISQDDTHVYVYVNGRVQKHRKTDLGLAATSTDIGPSHSNSNICVAENHLYVCSHSGLFKLNKNTLVVEEQKTYSFRPSDISMDNKNIYLSRYGTDFGDFFIIDKNNLNNAYKSEKFNGSAVSILADDDNVYMCLMNSSTHLGTVKTRHVYKDKGYERVNFL